MEGLIANAAVVAGIVVGMAAATAAGYGAVAIAVVTGIGWALAGYEAGKFMVSTIQLALDLRDTPLCDRKKLKEQGKQLANSVVALGTELASSALLGGLGKMAEAARTARNFAEDSAYTLWRKIRDLLRRDDTSGGLCSFSGDTLVVTENGYKPIQNITAGQDRVWARDEQTGRMGWQDVLAQYSNRYAETVHITAVDQRGHSQTISANRIHPFFARIAAGALVATSSVPAMASEGHVYQGDIAGGAWIDAQHLQVGDQLLSQNNQWQRVQSVDVDAQPLQAYNLSVDEYATYFVAGEPEADAVWVHNRCFGALPDTHVSTGELTAYNQPIYHDPKNPNDELYLGHDGRFYDINEHPPTARNDVDELQINRQTELHGGYRYDNDGNVLGPGGATYEPTGRYDDQGYEIFKNQNSSNYKTFHDDQAHSVKSPYRDRNSQIGLTGERRTTQEMIDNGWEPIGNTQSAGGDFDSAVDGYKGTQGIDGIFKRKIAGSDPVQYEYVVVETKASVNGSAGDLATLTNGERQMSEEWLRDRLGKFFPNGSGGSDLEALTDQLDEGNIRLVKADVTNVNVGESGSGSIKFEEINLVGRKEVTLGNNWNP